MNEISHILRREFIYLWYYFELQLRQIFWYWVLGIAIGSFISVFARDGIHNLFRRMQGKKWGIFGIVPACLLGIASPLCMYGTIPIAASFSRQGMRHDWLASFMMASILLNPQLIVYSAALGPEVLTVRIISCFLCGCAAGLLIHIFYRERSFFDFSGFEDRANHDTHPNILIRYLLNVGRNIRATGPYFLFGILLSALFQRYVPQEHMVTLFGGMSIGSAAAFMLTGPATKITNLGALKIVLGLKRFLLYLAFVMVFALLTGIAVNLIL